MEKLPIYGVHSKDAYRSFLVHFRNDKDARLFFAKIRRLGSHLLGIVDEPIERFRASKEQAFAEYWRGMPTYKNKPSLRPKRSVRFYVDSEKTGSSFAKALDQRIVPYVQQSEDPGHHQNRGYWFPAKPVQRVANKRYIATKQLDPKYPVYIISKGRHESRLTSKALEKMKVPYKIVVEPQEYDAYASVIDPKKILKLPFSNLGQGSIPARNWVWDHAQRSGHKRHWILDDNMPQFRRRNNGSKIRVATGNIFRAAEDFVDRYTNVAMAGFNYQSFVPDISQVAPVTWNTRIYSCILINHELPHRWRGKYNEDTDLSLRALKDGWCTILFNAFLVTKMPTMMMKGGNTDEVYKRGQNRMAFARSLQKQHPDVTRVVRRFGRPHHLVNYRPFKENAPIMRKGFKMPEGTNEYFMQLATIREP